MSRGSSRAAILIFSLIPWSSYIAREQRLACIDRRTIANARFEDARLLYTVFSNRPLVTHWTDRHCLNLGLHSAEPYGHSHLDFIQ